MALFWVRVQIATVPLLTAEEAVFLVCYNSEADTRQFCSYAAALIRQLQNDAPVIKASKNVNTIVRPG